MANQQGMIHPRLVSRLQPTFYPSSATITRKTLTSDGKGGHTPSWATVTTADCRYAPSSGQGSETINADRLENASSWVFAFAGEPDIQDNDRIVVDGRTFEVAKNLSHTVSSPLSVQAVEVV